MESIKKLSARYSGRPEVTLMSEVLKDEAAKIGLREMFSNVYGVSTDSAEANRYVFRSIRSSCDDVCEFADALSCSPYYVRLNIPVMVSEGAFAIIMMNEGLFEEAFCLYTEWKDKQEGSK